LAEARRLKGGKWRLYMTPNLAPVRDPETGEIATFDSLDDARRWWADVEPSEPPLDESIKCAWCGAYFGGASTWRLYAGRYYHPSHTPQDTALRRRPG
jgi:hypothetical protein